MQMAKSRGQRGTHKTFSGRYFQPLCCLSLLHSVGPSVTLHWTQIQRLGWAMYLYSKRDNVEDITRWTVQRKVRTLAWNPVCHSPMASRVDLEFIRQFCQFMFLPPPKYFTYDQRQFYHPCDAYSLRLMFPSFRKPDILLLKFCYLSHWMIIIFVVLDYSQSTWFGSVTELEV